MSFKKTKTHYNQLTLFPLTTDQIMNEICSTNEQVSNIRRGLFKRYSEMSAEIEILKEEVRKLLQNKLGNT